MIVARPIRVRAGFADCQSSLLLWPWHEEKQGERDDEKTCEKHGHSCEGGAVAERQLLALCEFGRTVHSFPRYPVVRLRGSSLKIIAVSLRIVHRFLHTPVRP
jgi:hypothetical protein